MLSDAEKLRIVELLINNVEFPDDGTYEDMYNQLNGEMITLLRRLHKVVIEGDSLSVVIDVLERGIK